MLGLLLVLFFGVDVVIEENLSQSLTVPVEMSPILIEDTAPLTPVAEVAPLMEFMGGQGCTFGLDSMTRAVAAGFDAEEIDRAISEALEAGNATQQGIWVVLNEDVCTIRLPDIQSEWQVDDPEIQGAAPYIREVFSYEGEPDIVEEGCYLNDGPNLFTGLANGDADTGHSAYIRFLGASIISGDVRFYSPSPLRTPIALQVMSGPGCDSVPNASAVAASHPFLVSDFGSYIRQLGEGTSCDDSSAFVSAGMIAARIQGADLSQDAPEDPNINAWLFFEWDLITMAAGWHEGMSGTDRGVPRPPLCHYP